MQIGEQNELYKKFKHTHDNTYELLDAWAVYPTINFEICWQLSTESLYMYIYIYKLIKTYAAFSAVMSTYICMDIYVHM